MGIEVLAVLRHARPETDPSRDAQLRSSRTYPDSNTYPAHARGHSGDSGAYLLYARHVTIPFGVRSIETQERCDARVMASRWVFLRVWTEWDRSNTEREESRMRQRIQLTTPHK